MNQYNNFNNQQPDTNTTEKTTAFPTHVLTKAVLDNFIKKLTDGLGTLNDDGSGELQKVKKN